MNPPGVVALGAGDGQGDQHQTAKRPAASTNRDGCEAGGAKAKEVAEKRAKASIIIIMIIIIIIIIIIITIIRMNMNIIIISAARSSRSSP